MTADAPARVLRVDLTSAEVRSEAVPERWLRKYVGGKGLGARYLYDELDAGVDPLGPGNALVFAVGPLTGVLPGGDRYAAITKSPQTGGFLDSYGGGTFPAALAAALDDHLLLVVTGAADGPVRVVVEDGDARIEPADDLWGADTVETAEAFPDAAVAGVGPAGEREVRFATVASDAGDHHAGRGGAGAVMGSKNLKCVVARGDPDAVPARTAADDVERLREAFAERYAESDSGRWQAASETLESVDFANETDVLSTRGWQEGSFEGTDDIGVEAAREAATGRERDDEAVPGGFRVETDEGETVPRGATQMTLGAGLGVDDFDAVATLGAVCDRLGVDVIGGGNAVAWAVRASDEGLVERDLSFGDSEAARELIEEIGRRETPLGDALADGVDAAAARYGGESFVPTVKGVAAPSYDPRGAPAMALAYATSDRGACHRRARPVEREAFTDAWDPERAAAAVADEQNARAGLWCLVADDFAGEALSADLGAALLDAVGWPRADDDLRTTGERVWTLVRLFNLREGFDRSDDELPAVFARERDDGAAVSPDAFESLLSAYYETRGWDAGGRPTAAMLSRLGLGGVADEDTPVGDADAAPADERALNDDD